MAHSPGSPHCPKHIAQAHCSKPHRQSKDKAFGRHALGAAPALAVGMTPKRPAARKEVMVATMTWRTENG